MNSHVSHSVWILLIINDIVGETYHVVMPKAIQSLDVPLVLYIFLWHIWVWEMSFRLHCVSLICFFYLLHVAIAFCLLHRSHEVSFCSFLFHCDLMESRKHHVNNASLYRESPRTPSPSCWEIRNFLTERSSSPHPSCYNLEILERHLKD